MKKLLLLLVITFLLPLVFALSSCGEPKNKETDIKEIAEVKYEVVTPPEEKEFVLAASFTDGEYNYYIFDLGYIKNARLSSGQTIRYEGKTPITVQLSKTNVTTNSVSDSIEETVSKTITEIHTGSAEASFTIGKETWWWGLELGASYSRQWGTNTDKQNSTTNTTTTIEEVSESLSETIEYTIGEHGEKSGKYRISIFVDYDAYLQVKTSIDNSKMLTKEVVLSARNDTEIALESVGLDEEFKNIKAESQIVIPEIDLSELEIPENKKDDDEEQEEVSNPFIEEATIYKDLNSASKITQNGWYGYGCAKDKREILKLSEYKEYFSDDYMFCFNIKLGISEIDDGWQEVYLYNKDNEPSTSEMGIHELKTEKGLIGGVKINHTPNRADANVKEYDVVWYVSGKDVKEEMYICYDAHGNNDDDWYKKSIIVDLVISKAEEGQTNNNFYSSNKPITITEDGAFGTYPRNKDTISNLEKYEGFKNENYLFVLDVEVELHEKNLGYQELFLYNQDPKQVSTLEGAFKAGLLAGMQIEHSGKEQKSKYNFTWYVTGDQITDYLYILYDAHGLEEDDWYRDSINVELRVFEIPAKKNGENIETFVFQDYDSLERNLLLGEKNLR